MNPIQYLSALALGAVLLLSAPLPRAEAQQPGGAPPASAAGPQTAASEIERLKKRISQLEQQISDLQVLYGTLESLAGSGGGAPSAGGGFAGGPLPQAVTDRMDAMETQIRALAGQLQRGGAVTQAPPPQAISSEPLGRNPRPPTGLGPPPQSELGQRITAGPPGLSEFGTQVVRESGPAASPGPLPPPSPFGTQPQADEMPLTPLPGQTPGSEFAAAALPASGPKALYEEAYGHLLRQDYSSAEVKFSEFLRRHPNDGLAGNAQFWLGESFYMRGDYRKAAENFLKGYKAHKRGPKASDSLLKLAMSLKQLGQKDAACTTFRELNSKFPNAPRHVRQRADAESRGAGC